MIKHNYMYMYWKLKKNLQCFYNIKSYHIHKVTLDYINLRLKISQVLSYVGGLLRHQRLTFILNLECYNSSFSWYKGIYECYNSYFTWYKSIYEFKMKVRQKQNPRRYLKANKEKMTTWLLKPAHISSMFCLQT